MGALADRLADSVDAEPSRAERSVDGVTVNAAESVAESVTEDAVKSDGGALATLTPRQRQAITAYADPSSETYGNGKQSYRKAYGSAPESAESSWSRLVSNDKGRGALSDALSANRLDIQSRVSLLSSIAHGSGDQTETTCNADGDVVRTVSHTGRGTSDRLRAIDIANRMSGAYSEADARVSVHAAAARELIKRNVHLLD